MAQRFTPSEPVTAYVVVHVRTKTAASYIAAKYDPNTNPPVEEWQINNDASAHISLLIHADNPDTAVRFAIEQVTGDRLRELLRFALLDRYGLMP